MLSTVLSVFSLLILVPSGMAVPADTIRHITGDCLNEDCPETDEEFNFCFDGDCLVFSGKILANSCGGHFLVCQTDSNRIMISRHDTGALCRCHCLYEFLAVIPGCGRDQYRIILETYYDTGLDTTISRTTSSCDDAFQDQESGGTEAPSLVKENRLWSNTSYGTELEFFYEHTNWIKFEGDTIIGDTPYMVIWRSDDEFHEDWYRVGAIRVDENKKVYMHRDGEDSLLYDFSVHVGDSFRRFFGEYVYVVKVDSVEPGYFEKPVKRIILDYRKEYVQGSGIRWIEGMGSMNGILAGLDNIGIVGASYELVCFEEDGDLMYRSENHVSCFPLGYEGLHPHGSKDNGIIVITGKELITFQFGKPASAGARLMVFDVTGKLRGSFDASNVSSLDVPNTGFNPGFYIYCFSSREWNEAGKFVVE